MSDLHGTFREFDPPIDEATDQIEVIAAFGVDETVVVVDSVAEAEFDAEPEPSESDDSAADGFDRARVLRLLDRLERDVVAVETAMVHVEAGEHEAYAAAVATIDARATD